MILVLMGVGALVLAYWLGWSDCKMWRQHEDQIKDLERVAWRRGRRHQPLPPWEEQP